MPIRHRTASWILAACLAITMVIAHGRISAAQTSKATEVSENDFYRPDEVQSIHLQVAEDELNRMRTALPERVYGRASFRWRDISIDNVAIRFKGNSSSSPTQQHKRSFLIKFDEFTDNQRFLGLRRVSFDNAVQFGSLFSEPIVTEILRDQGITTQRCNYAKLYLNGKYHGLYVNVERIDEVFVKHRLPDPNGMLFKVDEGGPGGNLQLLGDDPTAYERTFEPETKSSKKGHRRLVEFIGTINQSPAEDFAANLESKFAVDNFLRVTAVMLFAGAFDQLTGWNPHNYYLYYDGKQQRWQYLPWDLDVGFCEVAFGQIHVLDDWNAAWPAPGQQPHPLLDRIVADPVLLKRYRHTARIILDKYFEPERLCGILDAKYALIKTDLLADPFPHRRITNPEDRNYDDIVASMKKFIRKRDAAARQQLANPGQRPAMVLRAGGPPHQLAEKVQRVMRGAEKMQRNGQDVSPIQKVMRQVGPLLDKGRPDEAEKLIAEALRLVGEDTSNVVPKTPPTPKN
jgi:spore coat protein CotH